MKKCLILLAVLFIAVIFIAGCVMDSVYYCPYCSSANVTVVEDGVYKCEKSSCGKTFGAKAIYD
jgi:ribosomal protein L37AE/L43A